MRVAYRRIVAWNWISEFPVVGAGIYLDALLFKH